MTLYLSPLVEGETEEACVPQLLERIWGDLLHGWDKEPLVVLPPEIVARSSILKATHPLLAEVLERHVRFVRRRCQSPDRDRTCVLLLLDAEEDCPKELNELLLKRIRLLRSDLDVAVVLAKRQLENWFKAAASSLAGHCHLPSDLTTPADPEHGSGDTWLATQMQKVGSNNRYEKRFHAPILVREMNLCDALANSRSFRKLHHELQKRLPPSPEPPCAASV